MSMFNLNEHINNDKLYWASFERFELRLSGKCVKECYHPGDCEADTRSWVAAVRDQLAADKLARSPTPDKIREELKEYGNWDAEELADDEMNFVRLIWLAAGNIAEDDAPDCSEPHQS